MVFWIDLSMKSIDDECKLPICRFTVDTASYEPNQINYKTDIQMSDL